MRNIFIGGVVFIASLLGLILFDDKKTERPANLAATSTVAELVQATTTISRRPSQTGYKVVKVVDGDTVVVEMDGQAETLRLIGINTPETVDSQKPVECFGREASAKAKALLTGQTVKLVADLTQGERDKYGRLLRYVFLANGTNFNQLMIEEGYAYEYTYNLPYQYQTKFKTAERRARLFEKGLWAAGVCEKKVTPAALRAAGVSLVSTPTSKNSGQYICTNNIYNCSDFSSQTEAQTVFLACGGPAADPHELDRDGDGAVCESLK